MSGIIVIMVGHGICSSGLFYMCNLFYERVGRRNLILLKGLGYYMGIIIRFWFMNCIINLGVPFSINFMGEVLLLVRLISYNFFIIIVLILLSFLGARFSLYLFIQIFHGKT